ncbi:HEPN domain-containing protein [Faecalicatena contorta]|uniref:HEPN domain-containing protein n=1 Tax=Faecalicatena contorta TaxID=39482 RepID=UPI00241F0BA9|nr:MULTISPECIES: HEPN domain-containing protein [Clostridia]
MSLSGIRRYCHTTVILKRKGLLSVLSDDIINLVKYRITNAEEKMISANLLLEAGQFKDSIGRSYYAMFSAVRALLACDGVDYSKHLGVIAYFQKN